jgi:hypothetical protein
MTPKPTKKTPAIARPLFVWTIYWCDDNVVVEDHNPEFLYSIHATRKSAAAQVLKMKKLASFGFRNSSGKVTTHYRIVRQEVLP